MNSPPRSAAPSPNSRIWPVVDELGQRPPPPATSCTWSAARSDALLAGSATTSTSALTRTRPDLKLLHGWAEAIWETAGSTARSARPAAAPLEITTFRAEAADRVRRHPTVRYGTSLVEDLRRRDFTVNAMALSLPGHRFTTVRRAA